MKKKSTALLIVFGLVSAVSTFLYSQKAPPPSPRSSELVSGPYKVFSSNHIHSEMDLQNALNKRYKEGYQFDTVIFDTLVFKRTE